MDESFRARFLINWIKFQINSLSSLPHFSSPFSILLYLSFPRLTN